MRRSLFDSSRGSLNDEKTPEPVAAAAVVVVLVCTPLSEMKGSSSSHPIESSIMRVRSPTRLPPGPAAGNGHSINDESGESHGEDESSTSEVSLEDSSSVSASSPIAISGIVMIDGKTALQVMKQSKAECKRPSLLLE